MILTIRTTGDSVLVDDDVAARLPTSFMCLDHRGYVRFWQPGEGNVCLHAVVMGGTRKGKHIDHINGDKLDNRRANLRFVTPTVNQMNRRRLNRNNSSGARGVVRRKDSTSMRPWRAYISLEGKRVWLGQYATQDAAIAARRAAELAEFGEECPTWT